MLYILLREMKKVKRISERSEKENVKFLYGQNMFFRIAMLSSVAGCNKKNPLSVEFQRYNCVFYYYAYLG